MGSLNYIEKENEFKSFLMYILETYKEIENNSSDEIENAPLNNITVYPTAHDYYKIFHDLCYYRKSSSNGYFSLEWCKDDKEIREQCKKNFHKIMKDLIIREAKNTFSSSPYCPSFFSSQFLTEDTKISGSFGNLMMD